MKCVGITTVKTITIISELFNVIFSVFLLDNTALLIFHIYSEELTVETNLYTFFSKMSNVGLSLI